jgi:hypothetical protein
MNVQRVSVKLAPDWTPQFVEEGSLFQIKHLRVNCKSKKKSKNKHLQTSLYDFKDVKMLKYLKRVILQTLLCFNVKILLSRARAIFISSIFVFG